jgi:hypothetical protein
MIVDLSRILSGAGLPAGAVIAFFWKADDALSAELKQWLSAKIEGVVSNAAETSSLLPIARVFDFLFGTSLFAPLTLMRVALVSTATFLIVLAATDLSSGKTPLASASYYLDTEAALLLLSNMMFDVLSVTKARYIINACMRRKARSIIVFFVLDIFATFVLLCLYGLWLKVEHPSNPGRYGVGDAAWIVWVFPFVLAILATSFLTTLLTSIYLVSLTSLRWARLTKLLSGLVWALPVREKPVRSIGVVAGGLVFAGVLMVSGLTSIG